VAIHRFVAASWSTRPNVSRRGHGRRRAPTSSLASARMGLLIAAREEGNSVPSRSIAIIMHAMLRDGTEPSSHWPRPRHEAD
jgi:hypothetical protein